MESSAGAGEAGRGTCPACGGSSVILDEGQGVLVCKECGTCQEDVSHTLQQSHISERPPCPSKAKYNRGGRIARGYPQEYSRDKVKLLCSHVRDIARSLRLSNEVMKLCEDTVASLVGADAIKKNCRSLKVIAAAIVMKTAQRQQTLSFREMEVHAGVNKKQLYKALTALKDKAPELFVTEEKTDEQRLKALAERLPLSPQELTRVIATAEDVWQLLDCCPSHICRRHVSDIAVLALSTQYVKQTTLKAKEFESQLSNSSCSLDSALCAIKRSLLKLAVTVPALETRVQAINSHKVSMATFAQIFPLILMNKELMLVHGAAERAREQREKEEEEKEREEEVEEEEEEVEEGEEGDLESLDVDEYLASEEEVRQKKRVFESSQQFLTKRRKQAAQPDH